MSTFVGAVKDWGWGNTPRDTVSLQKAGRTRDPRACGSAQGQGGGGHLGGMQEARVSYLCHRQLSKRIHRQQPLTLQKE